jgi:hypothetical protein
MFVFKVVLQIVGQDCFSPIKDQTLSRPSIPITENCPSYLAYSLKYNFHFIIFFSNIILRFKGLLPFQSPALYAKILYSFKNAL